MSEPSQTPERRSAWPRWRSVLFYASLGLNVLIIGVIAGALSFGERPAKRAAIDSAVPLMRALTPEQRGQLWREVRGSARAQGVRPLDPVHRTRQVMTLLRAEDFDAEAFESVLRAQGAANDARVEAGRAALTELLSGMSVTERRGYADRLEQALRKSARDRKPPARHDGSSR